MMVSGWDLKKHRMNKYLEKYRPELRGRNCSNKVEVVRIATTDGVKDPVLNLPSLDSPSSTVQKSGAIGNGRLGDWAECFSIHIT